MKMKRAAAFLLALCMAVSLLRVGVLADGEADPDTWAELAGALQEGGAVALGGDVTADPEEDPCLKVPEDRTVTLDLNGHTIDGSALSDFTLYVRGTLTLKDSRGSGKLVGSDDGAIYVGDGGKCTVTGGAITAKNAAHGAVSVGSGAAFTVSGGEITAENARYGAVCVSSGAVFTVSGAPAIGSVYLGSGAVITVGGELTRKTPLPVKTADTPTDEAPVIITSGLSGRGSEEQFISVDTDYAVYMNKYGEAELRPSQTDESIIVGNNYPVTLGKTYAFIPEDDGTYIFYSVGEVDTVGGLYLNDELIAESDGGGEGHNFRISVLLSAKSRCKLYVRKNGDAGDGSDCTVVVEYRAATEWERLQLLLSGTKETVTLTQNYKAVEGDSALKVPNGRTVTLDLNGYTVDRALTTATENGYVINIAGTLTIADSSSPSKGKITGGKTNGKGGGVYVDGGTFNLQGGSVTNNTASIGGGVYVGSGTFNLSGGSVTANKANTSGGGVYVDSSGTFTLSDNPVISGNTMDDSERTAANVKLHSETIITLTGALTEGASIGVTTENAPADNAPVAFTSGWSTYMSGADPADFFTSDKGYSVVRAGGEAAVAATTYPVTVTNGTGGGSYAAGDSVTITANEPETGKRFKAWTGVDGLTFTSGSATTATAAFTMPARAVNVTATYEDIPAVPVTGVTLNRTTLSLTRGNTATLTATVAPSNATNKAVTWSSGSPGVATVDANGKVTAVAVGTAIITVTTTDGGKTAQCTVTVSNPTPSPTPSGGGDGDDDTPSTSSGTTTTTANPDGSKTTTMTNADGSKTAVTTAKDGCTATVKTDKSGSTVSVAFSVSQKAAEETQRTGAPIQLPAEIAPVAPRNAATAAVVAITVPNAFIGGGAARVEIEVTRSGPGVIAMLRGADGGLTPVKECYEGSVILPVTESCEIVIVDNTKTFSDVKANDWFYDNVTFVTAREIFNGTGDGLFTPNAAMTRGMLAQALYNFDRNAAPNESYAFADARGKWYAGAASWAASVGVVTGTDEGFEGEANVTREAVATMLYRYAKAQGYDVAARADLSAFADAASVSDWALEAMQWAVGTGLVNGMDGFLAPQAPATRAQLAAIIERFVENVVN